MFGYTLKKEDANAIKEYIGKGDITRVYINWSRPFFWWSPKWNSSIDYQKWDVKIEKKFHSENLEEVLLWIKETSEQLISMESK